jgi:hypothetical protein
MADWISSEVESSDNKSGDPCGADSDPGVAGIAGTAAAETGVISKEISSVPHPDRSSARPINTYKTFFILSPQAKSIIIPMRPPVPPLS